MKVLGQYADDLDLYLLGDQNSLDTALKIIDNFGRYTGFKINYDKTTVYRIGSLRYSQAMMYTADKICWTSEPINILGVNVTHEKEKASRNQLW